MTEGEGAYGLALCDNERERLLLDEECGDAGRVS